MSNVSFAGEKGDRRVRLQSLPTAKSKLQENEVEVTLSQLLMGEVPLRDGDGEIVFVFSPINLTGLAMLEEEYGSLDELNKKLNAYATGNNLPMSEVRKIVTVLVNQDLPISKHWSEHDVGRKITDDTLRYLIPLIGQLMSPTDAGSQTAPRNPAKEQARRVGKSSSTRSRSGTGGQSTRSRNSR